MGGKYMSDPCMGFAVSAQLKSPSHMWEPASYTSATWSNCRGEVALPVGHEAVPCGVTVCAVHEFWYHAKG
jgi:hypothetical protein